MENLVNGKSTSAVGARKRLWLTLEMLQMVRVGVTQPDTTSQVGSWGAVYSVLLIMGEGYIGLRTDIHLLRLVHLIPFRRLPPRCNCSPRVTAVAMAVLQSGSTKQSKLFTYGSGHCSSHLCRAILVGRDVAWELPHQY